MVDASFDRYFFAVDGDHFISHTQGIAEPISVYGKSGRL